MLLTAQGLGRRHPGGPGWLLQDVSLAIAPGDRVAVMGPSGSGKTLLLRALVLLDPSDAGEVRWQGRVVRRERIPSFRSQAVYLHQRPAFHGDTVEEALMRPFTLGVHRGRPFDGDRLADCLGRLGRDRSFLAKRVRDLSGGEMQVASLVRAMALEPKLLLLDEPAAALDARTAEAVESLIADWVDQAAGSRAVVWVGHDEAQARRVTCRSLAVRDGRVEDGPW